MFNHLINATIAFPYTTHGVEKQRQVTVEKVEKVDTGFFRVTGKEPTGAYKSFNLYENQLTNVQIIG